jgi:hypothetical protein
MFIRCLGAGYRLNSLERVASSLTQEGADVRFGSQADICGAIGHVRFTPNSDHESGLRQNVMSALPPIATAKADIGKPSCPLCPRKQTCAVQPLMSAKGQKRTCAVHYAMSALPPVATAKADIALACSSRQ